MKKYFLLFLFSCSILYSQSYQPKSSYINNPQKFTSYVDSCANFWLNAWDSYYGGFYTDINKYGSRMSSNKSTLVQSRNVYGLVKAFMLTGKKEYLNLASEALQFIYEKSWDKNYGGWINQLNRNGSYKNKYDNKSAFDQHYSLLGILAFYEATNDTMALKYYKKGKNFIEQYLWDERESYFGYYDYTNYNGTSPKNKSFNSTVDALTTHLFKDYLLFGTDSTLRRIENVYDNIKNHLIRSMENQKIGFAEKYDSDWNIVQNETMTIMGHVLKTAWCLGRYYQLNPDAEILSNAELLVDEVLSKGYDHQFGGPYKDYNRQTGDMLMWGQDTAKAWWQMEQAFNAGMELYQITGENKYLEMADETLNFFMKYFVDHQYGEVYADRLKRGGFVWNENKGSGGKAGYHSIELGYLGYLYSSAFVNKNDFTLYYYNDRLENHTMKLNPLEIDNNLLKIKSVQINSITFNSFDEGKRELYLTQKDTGIIKVTFSVNDPTHVASNKLLPGEFRLSDNYPNPFNPSTTISFTIPKEGNVSLEVFNILGEKVSVLAKRRFNAGTYNYKFEGINLSSGVYFYRLTYNNSYKVKKMILAK